ncbi:MAG: isoprenylcysteine carboxylmethyltransferase family protein [Patescibacteria group bacterium]
MNDQILRIATIFILIGWRAYWEIKAQTAQKAKPAEKKKKTFFYLFQRHALTFPIAIVVFQLIGLPIFIAPVSDIGLYIGFSMVLVGAFISIHARRILADNWTHAFDYQVKIKHELIISGIYKYIRHPIYTGMIVCFVGAEIVARSYLFIPLFIIMFLWAYFQGKSEERILRSHFGVQYEKYMTKSKMLIPFLL